MAIVGDIVHSARGALRPACARHPGRARHPRGRPQDPRAWPTCASSACRVCHDLAEGIAGADVVITLRLQNERMSGALLPSSSGEYFQHYGLTEERGWRKAKADCIVMHPGPINRGVEIDSQAWPTVRIR